jgi:RHH-type transcriptional regulator, proline utilization regulon repressor / proline dehydrogenase / delta 1-pyrroline-5-carboxylate dehydrogenase
MFSALALRQTLTLHEWRQALQDNYVAPEAAYLTELIQWLDQDPQFTHKISQQTLQFLDRWRQTNAQSDDWAQKFLHAYGLNTREGVVLMCLAEALVRIPDKASARQFIADKLGSADWQERLGENSHWLINASTWALFWGERLVDPREGHNVITKLTQKISAPIIQTALEQSLSWLADTFVFATDIPQAIKKSAKLARDKSTPAWRYSFDLLGEAAISHEVAARYRANYLAALTQLKACKEHVDCSLSIKLSALHPRYEPLQEDQLQRDLIGTDTAPGFLVELAAAARAANIPLTIDAEESDRLELSLNLLEACMRHPQLNGWNGMGLAVQAYSKRALPALGWLNQLAQELGIQLNIRLVKGAYWDSEIYWAQTAGLAGYPVFTDKTATDIAYLACAKFLLQAKNLHPQFATHNASTLCSLIAMAEPDHLLEFQRLQGMGESLYRQLLHENPQVHCRIYAPIGQHAELLPYLVRRLLENGANNSFINQLNQKDTTLEQLAQHPLHTPPLQLPTIVLPADLFRHADAQISRANSQGVNLAISAEREALSQAIAPYYDHHWNAGPIINGNPHTGPITTCTNPADQKELVGELVLATPELTERALAGAHEYHRVWRQILVQERATVADAIGDAFEIHRAELCALLVREAGKTLADAINEVREAVDFCHYYAQQARQQLALPLELPGPTGEHNQLVLEGRGVFVCISPWNFPLAIFTGQIIAALVTGNTVVAKPARQTSLIAFRVIELMHQAGIPARALHFLPGNSGDLGPQLTSDSRIEGIAFTGSTQSAWTINRALAARTSSIASLIAETGGQNALIADSTCLPEQLVKDVIRSAFGSAGQRCSALRVLYVQEDIADKVIELLSGAMACLRVGDPRELTTDIGPVIDTLEQQKLLTHIDEAARDGRILAQVELPRSLAEGSFVAPTLVQIDTISQLQEEHFGPICHLIRFHKQNLEQVIADINATGYGLTLGIHTRNESLAQQIAQTVNVGNVYINRHMVGAVVGVQPFGGCGLSGTGPKAGGPHYLLRFVREKSISNYLAAVGGNIQLLTQKQSKP